jgi:hypothetical protein
MAMIDCDDAVRAALAARLSILTAQGRRHGTTTAGRTDTSLESGMEGDLVEGQESSVVVRRSVLYISRLQ